MHSDDSSLQVAAAAGPAPGPSSPAPDWITNFRAPAAPVAKLSPVSDASSESKDDQPLAAAALAAGADKQRSSSSEPSSQPHKVAKPRSTAAKAMPGSTRPKPSKKHSAPTAVAEPAAKRPAPAQLPTRELADSTAGAPAKHLLDGTAKPAEAAQQAEAGPPQAKKPKARTMSAPGDAVKGEVTLMLPAKLAGGKYIMEMEPSRDGADDLTGDSGAVGRILVSGKGADATMQIDLKGALYDARLAPCAATLAVINLGQTEAKVEVLANQFLQLDRVNSMGDEDEQQRHLWDEQDPEQEHDAGLEDPKPKAGKGAAKKPGKKKPAGAKKAGAKKGLGKKKPATAKRKASAIGKKASKK